jgi:isopenicillin-N epimerase
MSAVPLASEWTLDPGVTYLNHGSFGPSPDVVRRARERYSEELQREPMDFFIRRMEDRLDAAMARLGAFVGAAPKNLAFVPNATCAMNVVVASTPLEAGDEVLFTDQEYGSVIRMWGRACGEAGAKTVIASLPSPPSSADEIVAAIMNRVTPRTRLIVVSHITSQTATIFPVEAICRAARQARVPVCIDGPHALAMQPLSLDGLGCDFYCASGHKWLSAPFGSGFLYVAPHRKQTLAPAIMSWGKSLSGRAERWQDEFHWFGTYDPAPFLAMADAIVFLEGAGLAEFRRSTHALARFARTELTARTPAEPVTLDAPEWYGSMVTLRLPQVSPSDAWPGKLHPLQSELWDQHRIEIPVFQRGERVHLRVSCHLYNSEEQIGRLVEALRESVNAGAK